MHRFIALRELKSSQGDVKPGSFFPDLEAADLGIQKSLVRRCAVHDLSGAIKLDKFERLKIRWLDRLFADLKAAGIDVREMEGDYAKAQGQADEKVVSKRKQKSSDKALKAAKSEPKKKAAALAKGRRRK